MELIPLFDGVLLRLFTGSGGIARLFVRGQIGVDRGLDLAPPCLNECRQALVLDEGQAFPALLTGEVGQGDHHYRGNHRHHNGNTNSDKDRTALTANGLNGHRYFPPSPDAASNCSSSS